MMRRAVHIAVVVVTLAAMAAGAAPSPALVDVKSTLAGVVLADGLVEVGARVDDAQPLLYVRTALTGARAVAARAPRDGTVREVLVVAGHRVEQGDLVARLEPR